MKLFKGKLVACLGLLFCGIVSADPWSGNATINTLYPTTDGLTFMTSYVNTELSLCDGGKRFKIAKTHPNYDVMVSTMISAFMSGKEISFNIESGQQPSCAPAINRFLLSK